MKERREGEELEELMRRLQAEFYADRAGSRDGAQR